MPIISAVVATIAAAVAATTAATVAAAAVAVGTVVGVVGLGMNVVGMATGNKTLSKIGGYLGMAGGVMGLVGGLAGGMEGYTKALSSAWDDGLGSMFSGTKSIGQAGLEQEAIGRAIVAGNNPEAGTYFASAGLPMDQNVLGNQIVSNTPMPPFTQPGQQPIVTPDILQSTRNAQYTQAAAHAVPDYIVPPSTPDALSPMQALDTTTQRAANGPMAIRDAIPTAPQSSLVSSQGSPPPLLNMNDAKNWLSPQRANEQPDAKSFWASLPDWAKGQIAISGAQGLAGLASGWFDGASAEQKLELERQAQQWRQQYENKNQAFAQQSASYAPLVSFGGTGTLNRRA